MHSHVVMTAGQERESRNAPAAWKGTHDPFNWKGKGTHLWRLKQEKPDLFEQTDKDTIEQKGPERPPGFEPCQMEGWLFNKEKNSYWNESAQKTYWFDEAEQVHKPLHEGAAFPCTFSGGGNAVPSLSVAPAASSTPATARRGAAAAPPAPKHVLISDLHAVAKALKKDFAHLDKPAGALAIVGLPPPGSAISTDVAARAVPEKLLRRLAAHRSAWSDDDLCEALAGSIGDVAAGDKGIRPNVAIALIVGTRIVAAAAPGSHIGLCTHSSASGDDPQGVAVCSPEAADDTATVCRRLGQDDVDTLTVSLAVGAAFSNFTASAPHLVNRRARAASVTHLRWMRDEGAEGPLGVACARLAVQSGAAASEGDSASSSAPPAAKRQKTEEVNKIRVRQILLKHSAVAKPTDLRNKRVTRSLEEAEEQMLGLLVGLVANSCAGFASTCKAKSECPSSLKGGEFAGDMGWLDRNDGVKAGASKTAIKLKLPPNVLKAAFDLDVGELSDIVTSDEGVHVVQRTA